MTAEETCILNPGSKYVVKGTPALDEKNQITGTIYIAEDITGRRKAEEKLEEAHNDLEQKVRERTEELARINERLLNEIEECKRANQALQEVGFQYKTVADLTYSWEYWSNPEGSFYYISPSCERVSGYTREQFLKDPNLLRQIILLEDREIWKQHNDQAWNDPKPLNLRFRIRRKDGQTRWIEHICQPVRDNEGKFKGVRASNRDITDRLRAEKELQKHREELEHASRLTTMGEFAASLAHELNQPLLAILTNAQLAKRFLSGKKLDLDRVHALLDDIIEGNRRISQLMVRMRRFLKKEKIPFDRLNISEVIQEVISLFYGDPQLGKATIITESAPDLPRVMGDRIQLQEVLLNLVMNGLDAMANMEPEARKLVIQTEMKNEETVRVGVQDFGIGLSKDILPKLFEPFFTTKPEGLGMGLAISKSIIEAHGGTLWAENNPHSGAIFWISLPVDHGENL